MTSGQRLTALEILARLVSFDTESSKSNLALIDFVEAYLKSWNVPLVRVPSPAGTNWQLSVRAGNLPASCACRRGSSRVWWCQNTLPPMLTHCRSSVATRL